MNNQEEAEKPQQNKGDGEVPSNDETPPRPTKKLSDVAQCLIFAPKDDAGNAERFEKLYEDEFIYVQEWKCWYSWNGCRWVEDTGDALATQKFVAMMYDAISEARKAEAGHFRKGKRHLLLPT